MRRLLLTTIALPGAAFASPALHDFKSVAIAPDGHHIAAIEAADSTAPATLLIRDLTGAATAIKLPCAPGPDCKPSAPSWSPDSKRLAFLLAHPTQGTTEIDNVPSTGGKPTHILTFAGPLESLRFSATGQLAVLATANAHKNVGRAEAGAPLVGEIGGAIDEQRIAVVDGDALRFVSPANFYVYEYDFLPNGDFVGTAAQGDGDSQWWVARLYQFNLTSARVLFTPSPREQLNNPAVSPDGKSVAFIGGWMSDFGSVGGDAFSLRLDQPNASPVNLTQGLNATVTALDWHCGPGLTGVTLAGDTLAITRLDAAGAPLWSGQQSLTGGPTHSISCGPNGIAAVASSFAVAPEIVAGSGGKLHAITHANAGVIADFSAKSITWKNDGFTVQGWLLSPNAVPATAKRPLIVVVHGGPEAAVTSSFLPADTNARALLAQGWDVFLPNYRGSFGQGEAFASASIQDLGGGDWRDVLTGLDAAEKAAPIDDSKLAITGGSYGGYMTMWAVTQTHRFRAAMSHAGVSDWLSIEGEAPQAGSDETNFGGSVYDNPAPYLKASPITHMRGVTTPVLITVGERDLECPMPQSQEFYTALQALHVPTDFIVYPGEGHALRKPADREDYRKRMLAWFHRWFDVPAK
jgi:dipeptidyl aminopeptidase/acylaminoacyl peptidase